MNVASLQHRQSDTSNLGNWLGPFESFEVAAKAMEDLGFRNTGMCRQCKPIREASKAIP